MIIHTNSLPSLLTAPGDRRWVGMWWGGFLLCGVILLVVAVPFFSFPKVLTREKKKIRKSSVVQLALPNNSGAVAATDELGKVKKEIVAVTSKEEEAQPQPKVDTGYGKDIKDIPQSMLRLVKNPVYIVTCLGACMELMIVSGFVVFLPKYLETQFSLGKSQANIFTGSIAVPGACIGIFLGGCVLKRFQLKPKGAVQFVLITNVVCLACYAMLFFLGCDNLKMAGTTIPYYTKHGSTLDQPFQVNLTAACNFGCECLTSEVEPVCGNNGLTYFSPCHAGCTAFSSNSNSNYTNCACKWAAASAPPLSLCVSKLYSFVSHIFILQVFTLTFQGIFIAAPAVARHRPSAPTRLSTRSLWCRWPQLDPVQRPVAPFIHSSYCSSS